jgi:TonB family protein
MPRRSPLKIQTLLTAALALSPALLHAQPAAPASAPAAGDTHQIRVSTGVVPPRLIHTTEVASEMDWEWAQAGNQRTAEVSLVVDATGKPTQVHILKSAGYDLDQNVLEAVDQYRFTPATVSSQPAPMRVDLTLNIDKPAYW